MWEVIEIDAEGDLSVVDADSSRRDDALTKAYQLDESACRDDESHLWKYAIREIGATSYELLWDAIRCALNG